MRISKIPNTPVTVRCTGCQEQFFTTTDDIGRVSHTCAGKPKGFFCRFMVDDDNLVAIKEPTLERIPPRQRWCLSA
jgi:hypothetical protein